MAIGSPRKVFLQRVGTRCVRSATLVVSLMVAEVNAQDFTYTNIDGTITITGSTPRGGLVGAIIIPGAINGLPVVGVGDAAFVTNFITSLIIPSSVTNIGMSAFLQCGLTNVTMVEGLMTIGNGAFANCSALPNVTIPDSVTSIAAFAFSGCSKLTRVVIGSGVTNIGDSAFALCYTLTNVYFKGDAPSVELTSFDTPTIVYYLPGTKGWKGTLGRVAAKLWNPQVQTQDGHFGVRQNRFGFDITGTPDIPLVVEASTNFAAPFWVPVQNCTLTNGSIYFSDPQWMNFPNRFYRIRWP